LWSEKTNATHPTSRATPPTSRFDVAETAMPRAVSAAAAKIARRAAASVLALGARGSLIVRERLAPGAVAR
jgi:hypothetical protein